MNSALSPDPHDYAVFTLIFTFPHILASFFSFADKDYINFYKRRLTWSLRIVFALSLVLSLLGEAVFFTVFATYTMSHVFLQQGGISKTLSRTQNKLWKYWQFLGVALSASIYLYIYVGQNNSLRTWMILSFILMLCAFCGIGMSLVNDTEPTTGKLYIFATTLLPIIGAMYVRLDYVILALAVPRIVHDITAYIFYISHDHNRNQQTSNNYLYKSFNITKIPVVLLSPALSILMAYWLQQSLDGAFLTPIVGLLFLFHYQVEGYVWKSDSMHRRYVKLATT